MRASPEYADLGGGLSCWQVYDPLSKVDLYASAVEVARKLYFVDPVPLARGALDALTADARPTGIILTNANHARAAEDFRRRFKIPVCIHAAAHEDIGLTPDFTLAPEGGEPFNGTFEAVPLPGAARGEIALYRPEGEGLLIVGDALINLPSHGFGLLPDKYCTSTKELRRSLGDLLRGRTFAKMLFAHGDPIMSGAHKRLAALL